MSDSYNNNQDSQDTGAYDQMSGQDGDMGGGRGALGSGVAGGYEGNQSQNQNQGQNQSQNSNQSQSATGTGTGQTAEKQDWLDKSLETAGKKFGVNISDANADKIGDFVNKEFQSKAGRGIPGVQ